MIRARVWFLVKGLALCVAQNGFGPRVPQANHAVRVREYDGAPGIIHNLLAQPFMSVLHRAYLDYVIAVI